MHEAERRLLVDGLAFALSAHAEQTRKGSEIPYASHLIQVAGLVLEAGGDAAQALAGLLHDCVEDCDDVTIESVRERFGDEVARIVEVCTDTLPGDSSADKSDWATRKLRYLDRLAAADARTRCVAACDKLHNLRSLVGDLRADGVATLERFTASPENTRWYYERAHAVLASALSPALRSEFDAAIDALAGFVPRAEAPVPGAD